MYLNIGDMAFCGKIPIDDKQFSISCDQYRDHGVEIPSEKIQGRAHEKRKETYIQLASYSFGPIM